MIEKPRIGDTYLYTPNRGEPVLVRVKGFRRSWVETDGVEDGAHRSVSRKQLVEVAR